MNSDNVIELSPGMDLLVCDCGEAWWVLDGWPRGAVAVDLEGNVVARHGQLICISCGTPSKEEADE